jgi:seryl-tRNA synthetase
MADNSRIRGFAAKEKKLQEKLDNLQSRYGKAIKLIEEEGDGNTSRTKGANIILSKIDEVKQELKDLKKDQPRWSQPVPQRRLRNPFHGKSRMAE